MTDVRQQAVTGVVPPQQSEARIREKWPAVTKFSGVASLARVLMLTTILAPLAWLLLLPFWVVKFLPFTMRRYLLTNKNLSIRAGWSGKVVQSVPLAEIDEVRLVTDSNTEFYRTATLEIVSNGQVRMRLPGVTDADSFRHAILNACNAWVPEKAKKMLPFIAASEVK